ncbi:MAG: O-antigen ligase family protein [Accumulibacter sp.]
MFEYIFLGFFFATPFVAALLSIAAVFLLAQRPQSGIAFVLASVCVEAFVVSPGGISLGINVFLTDLLPTGLFAIGLTRHLVARSSGTAVSRLALPVVWSCLLFISFIRGSLAYGASAGNDFRPFFYFLAVGIYLSSFTREQISFTTMEEYWIRASMVMVSMAVFRWTSDASGLRIGPDWTSIVVGGKFRVLTAGQSLFIATGMLMLASRSIYDGGRTIAKMMLVLMGGTVLLLQHRSVWVATIIGFLVIVAHVEKAHRRRLLIGAGWLAVISGLGVVAMSVLQLDSVSGDLRRSLEEISDKRSTIAGRIDGWFALVFSWAASGFVDMLIGQPMGSGYERYLEVLGRSVKENPHSYYVQILLRTGFIGLVCFVGMLTVLCARSLRHPSDENSRQRYCLLGLLAMNSIFFLVYQARFEQALVLVFAIVMTSSAFPRVSGIVVPIHRQIRITSVVQK